MLGTVPVGEFEDAEMRTVNQRLYQSTTVCVHHFLHLPDNDNQHGDKADGLQGVGPDDCLHPTSVGIEPYQQDAAGHGNPKGDVPGGKHVGL